MKVSIPGMETVRSDHFLCLEKVSFSLVSAQKDCLTSLRSLTLLRCLTSLHCLPSLRSGRQLLRSVRQLSFFSTTAENETFPRQMKQVFTSVPSLGLTFLGRGNIYSHHSLNMIFTEKDFRYDFFFILGQLMAGRDSTNSTLVAAKFPLFTTKLREIYIRHTVPANFNPLYYKIKIIYRMNTDHPSFPACLLINQEI